MNPVNIRILEQLDQRPSRVWVPLLGFRMATFDASRNDRLADQFQKETGRVPSGALVFLEESDAQAWVSLRNLDLVEVLPVRFEAVADAVRLHPRMDSVCILSKGLTDFDIVWVD